MIEAVIFDMDGLIIDSEPIWRASHREVFARYGRELSEDDVRAAAGMRTPDQVALWRGQFNLNHIPNDQVTDEIVEAVITAIHTSGVAMAGVDRLIRELHAHHMPMAVASSSTPRLIEVVLERLQLRDFMQAIHSAEHEERGKPFPDVFWATAKTLGVTAVNCLVFEDSLNGIKAAKAAGMKCIAVPELDYDRTAFEAAQPDRIVDSLEQIHWADIQSL